MDKVGVCDYLLVVLMSSSGDDEQYVSVLCMLSG